MSDEGAGEPRPAPRRSPLSEISADSGLAARDPAFWTKNAGAPKDLVARLEKAAGRRVVLSGAALDEWTEDLHQTYALLQGQRRLKKDKAAPSSSQRLKAATRRAGALSDELLGLLSIDDAAFSEAVYEAARALIVVRLTAEPVLAKLSRPGVRSDAPRQHAIRRLLALYRRGFGVTPPWTRGGPTIRFVAAMFDAATCPHLEEDTIYNLIVQARASASPPD